MLPQEARASSGNPSRGSAHAIVRLLRPHQWAKNLLVLLPLVFSHQVTDIAKLRAAILATIAFCLVASALYVINDRLDVESDRKHPAKRNRPFASGAIPLSWAPRITLALLIPAAGICMLLPARFSLVLLAYALLSALYSLLLKRRLLVDIVTLAGLYTMRLVAGSAATGIEISPWLFALALFMFASLAFAKRHAELRAAGTQLVGPLPGRGYMAEDLQVILAVGPACGLVAVLVLALYLNSAMVESLYRRPRALWLICPLMMYWITRVWFFANRGTLDEDPISFAIRDRVSWLVLAACTAVAIAATFL